MLAAVATLVGVAGVVLAAVLLAPAGERKRAADTGRDNGARVRRPPPRLAGTDAVTGNPVSLADYRGKPVVVNVWASWCAACAKEVGALKSFRGRHPDVALLGLAVQDTSEGAKAYYRRWQLKHPSILDAEGALAARLGITALPETIFLTGRHLIVTRITGPVTLGQLEEGLEQAKRLA